MNSYFKKTIRLTALASLPALLLTIAIPPHSAVASNFTRCASTLLSIGISEDDAGVACADALEPKMLSACVNKIQRETPITGNDALAACYRVRRPKELASCVVKIDSKIGTSSKKPGGVPQEESDQTDTSTEISGLALDNCRRSLLPKRFADCVVGLNRTISQLSGTEAIETCISAEDFPKELFPEN